MSPSSSITITRVSRDAPPAEGSTGRGRTPRAWQRSSRRCFPDALPFQGADRAPHGFYGSDVPVISRMAAASATPFSCSSAVCLSLRTKDETTEKAMERLMEGPGRPRALAIPTDEVESSSIRRLLQDEGAPYQRGVANGHREVSPSVPDTMDELLTIKGVGRKTANIVITEGFGAPASPSTPTSTASRTGSAR